MTPVEELMAQRDAVMFGEWVRSSPELAGQACLVQRRTRHAGLVFTSYLSRDATVLVTRALKERGERMGALPWMWNDSIAQDRDEVLGVLDDAIRLAKEDTL